MPPGPVLSLAVVKPQFIKYVERVDSMVFDAAKIEITNEESLKFAVALGGEAKKIAKAIEAKRKEVTADASDFVDAVNGFCKMFTEKLVANTKKTNGDAIEIVLKNKITSYQARIELDRRKQEEAARKAAAEFQAKLDAEAAEANRKAREEAERKAVEEAKAKKASEAEIEAARKAAAEEAAKHEVQAPQVPDIIIPKQETVTRTETGTSSHQIKTWKFEILDILLVPREYLIVNDKKLREVIHAGFRDIPGVRIFEESSTRFRS
jgi:flagellar biosynthesis GTPase FlhF